MRVDVIPSPRPGSSSMRPFLTSSRIDKGPTHTRGRNGPKPLAGRCSRGAVRPLQSCYLKPFTVSLGPNDLLQTPNTHSFIVKRQKIPSFPSHNNSRSMGCFYSKIPFMCATAEATSQASIAIVSDFLKRHQASILRGSHAGLGIALISVGVAVLLDHSTTIKIIEFVPSTYGADYFLQIHEKDLHNWLQIAFSVALIMAGLYAVHHKSYHYL